ncbi:MAG: prepilin-type N-terminal cleavage/methylation domain-containing protein [bacterium]|nr:prepilin-type N-terminal cleavage/methylation domain-containing protein [bacterium]
MNKQLGFSLIELLIVITVMGILITLAIPAYRSFNAEETVKNTARMVKDDIQFGINKSTSGVNAHWFGLAVQANSSVTPLAFDSYTNFEITPRDSTAKVVCPPNIVELAINPCSTDTHKKSAIKKYPQGVKLETITLFDKEATPIDYPSFIDVRFNQSPKSGQIIISSPSTSRGVRAQIARAELVYQNGTYQTSLVIDGGNICDETQSDSGACNNNLSGGSKPGRVFIVER